MCFVSVRSQVKIGKSSFSRQQVLENILGSIESIVSHLPRKWKNVQAIYLKTHDSAAIPIYNSLPTADKIVRSTLDKGCLRVQPEAGAIHRCCCL